MRNYKTDGTTSFSLRSTLVTFFDDSILNVRNVQNGSSNDIIDLKLSPKVKKGSRK
ncbi:MAG TPA: hypothetical protein VK338_05970 [Candidatus Nitrosocosmicus sp.]|nr:hypothetical protein [Candidatus Nitrosocosmicus sp.]